MTNRRRILLVTRNLPPLIGGMERLNWHIIDQLLAHAEISVIGPEASRDHLPEKASFVGVHLRPLWRFLLESGWQAISVARKIRPHLILAGSGLTAVQAVIGSRLTGAKSVVYVHGLDLTARHLMYRGIWHPALRAADLVIANSRATANLANQLGISRDKIRIVPPGVQYPCPPVAPEQIDEFRTAYGLVGKFILLAVGRLTDRKGILEFVKYSLQEIVKANPEVVFLVVGSAPSDALSAREQSREAIQAEALNLGIGDSVRFVGRVSEEELSIAYEIASVHIFPVRELPGDQEGFGMVAIEAAARGIPTVGFAVGGVVDAVAHEISGLLVEPGNYSKFSKSVIALLATKQNDWNVSAKSHAKEFSWGNMGQKLASALELSIDSYSSKAPRE